jgi:hypothetical protein
MDRILQFLLKRTGLIPIFSLTVIFIAAPAKEQALAAENPTAQEIIDRAVARAETQYQSQAEAMFESVAVSTIQSLDDDNEVAKTELTRYRLYPLHGALFEELLEKDGRPLSEKELRNEEKKKQDFIREVEKRRARGDHPQPESEPGVRFNHEFVERYQLVLAGTEVIRNHRCWVVAFEPKPGELPVRNRMDRALNQSTGKFWVSQDDYGLARIEFALREPFKYWGGFLAVIRDTDGRMDYERVEPNVWLPAHFNLKLDLRVMMVKDIRRLIKINWSDYRRSDSFAASETKIPD